MKKSLFAVAAVGAFAGVAGTAAAQSSVTVYGILDVGYAGSNSAATSNSTGATTKATVNALGQSAQSTSRLGFKGTEDIGGGLSAFFTAEFGLYPQEQDLSGTSQGGLRNRQTFVGLKQNGVGQGAVGTQYTPIHIAVSKTDPGQQNNQIGNVIYNGTGDGYNVKTGGQANASGYQTRYSNSLTLDTEVYSGLQGHLMYVLNNQNSTQTSGAATATTSGVTGGRVDTTGWVFGADYTLKSFFLTGNYSTMKQLTSANNCNVSAVNAATGVATATTCGFAGFGQASASGLPNAAALAPGVAASTAGNPMNVAENTWYVGASYDFGVVKAFAQYLNRKQSETANSNQYIRRSAQQLGVRGFATPTVEGWASLGNGSYTALGTNNSTSSSFNAWQLGSNYWLSKRTNLYAIYGAFNQSQPSNTTVRVNANSYAAGVRHVF